METLITLNLAGIKVNYTINVEHLYSNMYSFYVTNENGRIVLDGRCDDNDYYSYLGSQEVKLFSEVLDKKVKIELKKLAKSLGKKMKITN